jgi:hypothetical protein
MPDTMRDAVLRAYRPHLSPRARVGRPLEAALPDNVVGCHTLIQELKQEIWRLDRLIAGLRAASQDADRQGYAIDVDSFMRAAGEPLR